MRVQQINTNPIDINFHSILTQKQDYQNSMAEDENEDMNEDEDETIGWSEMSSERGGDETDDDYNERMEDLDNYLDNL